MKALPAIIVLAMIVFVNVKAILASRTGESSLHRAARIVGVAGLASLFVLVVAFAHAFTQIWVAEPGYKGLPLVLSVSAAVLLSISSVVLLIILRPK